MDGVVGAVGIKITVMVAVASEFSVPTLQRTVPPLADPQVPGLEVADTKLAVPVAGRKSVKVTLLVASPVLVSVYWNVIWLPTPTGEGEAVTCRPRLVIGQACSGTHRCLRESGLKRNDDREIR